MTRLLNDDIIQQVQDAFGQLEEPVHVLFFGRKSNCAYCDDTKNLVNEVTDLSDKLELTVYDLDEHADIAKKHNIDKAPGIVIAGKNGHGPVDYGIRYAGIPSGHEFGSLINDLIRVSGRDSGLSQETRVALAGLTEPVHLQVFVTPTCPYCPRAVILAHQFALESELVQAEMVEASEFPILSRQYDVSGVPDTSINHGANKVVGAVPESHLLNAIMQVVQN
jgi:glutaredoxin-like protein